jgi:hypothetical protein
VAEASAHELLRRANRVEIGGGAVPEIVRGDALKAGGGYRGLPDPQHEVLVVERAAAR